MSSHLHVPDHLRRIRSNPVARSLIELTGDKVCNIYVYIYIHYLTLFTITVLPLTTVYFVSEVHCTSNVIHTLL